VPEVCVFVKRGSCSGARRGDLGAPGAQIVDDVRVDVAGHLHPQTKGDAIVEGGVGREIRS
jgi:hypothetical protein